MINRDNFETDLNICKYIFEEIPDKLKPCWAGLILNTFHNYIKDIPDSIAELYSIIENDNRWQEAHGQFSKIRQFVLNHPTYQPDAFLLLAEKIAKVNYNASGKSSPFDADSGWYMPSLALTAATYLEDEKLESELRATILIVNNCKRYETVIQSASELILYRKIDEILWFDWDPIGVNDFGDARDEYESYVPEFFNLLKGGATVDEIAECLFKIEKEGMGLISVMKNCLLIADKIVSLRVDDV